MRWQADQVQGTLTILGHCVFEWIEERGGTRTVFVRDVHCDRCVGEVSKLGYSVLLPTKLGERRVG